MRSLVAFRISSALGSNCSAGVAGLGFLLAGGFLAAWGAALCAIPVPAIKDIIASESSALRNDKDMDCTVVLLGYRPTVDHGIMPQSNILLAIGAAILSMKACRIWGSLFSIAIAFCSCCVGGVFCDFFSHSCSQVEF